MDEGERRARAEERSWEATRVDALSDGVFAIAITLLVLNIEVPNIPADVAARELPGELVGLVPDIVSYVISFVVISAYWMAHRTIFRDILHVDRALSWLNILFLLFVAFLPFSTGVLDRYTSETIAIALYAVSLAVARLPLTAIWWYATSNSHLMHERVGRREIIFHRVRSIVTQALFLLSIGIAFISIRAAIVSWILLVIIDHFSIRLFERFNR